MLITLSGLDGAGKSTLADALQARLESDGIPTVIFHMNKDVGLYAYLRTARDGLKAVIGRRPSSPQGNDQPAAAAPGHHSEPGRAKSALLEMRRRIIWNKSLRRWVDLGDLATFLLYRLYVEKMRGRVLIMDRYFYDRMADIADGRRWRYLRWFSKITPIPDVPVLVEVAPEEAFSRKHEYSVESMTVRRKLYQEIFSWVPGSFVLANDDFDVAIDTLEQIVFDRLQTSGHRHLAAEN